MKLMEKLVGFRGFEMRCNPPKNKGKRMQFCQCLLFINESTLQFIDHEDYDVAHELHKAINGHGKVPMSKVPMSFS